MVRDRLRWSHSNRIWEARDSLRLLGVISIGWLLALGMRFAVPALLPFIVESFVVDNTTAGLAVTVIWGTYALMQFPAGLLIDRIGERILMSGGLFVALVALIALGSAPTFLLFTGAGALFGLATGLYGPARGTVLIREFPTHSGVAFGIILSAGMVGAVVLPFVSSWIAAVTDWRMAFLAFVPVFLVLVVSVWLVLPDRTDQRGQESLTIADFRSALLRRRVVLSVGALTLVIFGFQALSAFLPIYLVSIKNLAPTTASTIYALFFASGALVQPITGGIADRFGSIRVLIVLTGLTVLPLLVFPFVSGVVPLAVLAFVQGARRGLVPVNNTFILRALPDEVQGSAWGFIRTVFLLIASTGSLLMGVMADAGRFDQAFFVLAGISIVPMVLYSRLSP